MNDRIELNTCVVWFDEFDMISLYTCVVWFYWDKCWAVCEINIIHCCVRKWMILLLIYSVWVLLYWAVCYADVRIECHSCCVLIWMSFIYIILYVIRAVAIVFWTCCVIWFRYTNIGLAVWSGPYSRALDLLCDLVFIAQAICYSTTVYDREWFPLLCAIVDNTRVILCEIAFHCTSYIIFIYVWLRIVIVEPMWFVFCCVRYWMTDTDLCVR